MRSLAPLGRLARRLTGPNGRIALDGLIGVGLMTVTAAPLLQPTPAAAVPTIARPAVHVADVEPTPAPAPPGDPEPEAGTPVLTPTTTSDADVVHHVVAPGEHLWSIAADRLDDAWQRPVSDAEIAPYWRAIIDANRDRLVVAGEPDLIVAGQVFVLPPPGPDRG